MTLDEIAIKCGTDKATNHTVRGHGYAPHYDAAFSGMRFEPIKILEIGVGGGESIRTWLEYFTNAHVYGVDIVHSTNPWNTVNSGAHPRYTFVTGDQSSEVFWQCFIVDYGKNWNIIVDDGGHYSNQIITAHKCLWPYVVSGGLYCVEDMAVAYGTLFVPTGWPNHIDWLNGVMDKLNHDDGVDSIRLFNELAIIQKK